MYFDAKVTVKMNSDGLISLNTQSIWKSPSTKVSWQFLVSVSNQVVFLNKKNKQKFYLFERVCEKEHELVGGGQREKQGAWAGATSQDAGIMIWVQGRCLTDWTTQAPHKVVF